MTKEQLKEKLRFSFKSVKPTSAKPLTQQDNRAAKTLANKWAAAPESMWLSFLIQQQIAKTNLKSSWYYVDCRNILAPLDLCLKSLCYANITITFLSHHITWPTVLTVYLYFLQSYFIMSWIWMMSWPQFESTLMFALFHKEWNIVFVTPLSVWMTQEWFRFHTFLTVYSQWVR